MGPGQRVNRVCNGRLKIYPRPTNYHLSVTDPRIIPSFLPFAVSQAPNRLCELQVICPSQRIKINAPYQLAKGSRMVYFILRIYISASHPSTSIFSKPNHICLHAAASSIIINHPETRLELSSTNAFYTIPGPVHIDTIFIITVSSH